MLETKKRTGTMEGFEGEKKRSENKGIILKSQKTKIKTYGFRKNGNR